MRRDDKGMVQVISGVERQVSKLSAREDSTITTVRESKQSVEDVPMAKYKARALRI